MSQLNARKQQEAQELVKQAQKCLTKTIFKWQPDHLSAAPLFEKAANAFRAAGDYDQAIDMLRQSSSSYQVNEGYFKAAQNMESAAKLTMEKHKAQPQKGAPQAREFYQEAASLFTERGELSKASDALRKGATAMEPYDKKVAMKLYIEACDVMEALEKPALATDCFRKTFAFLVKERQIDEAIGLIPRMLANFTALKQETNVHKMFLTLTILQLQKGDVVQADQTFTQHLQDDGYLHSNECHAAEDLIIAFKSGNEQNLQMALTSQVLNFLDNQVVRVAKKLTLFHDDFPASTGAKSKPKASPAKKQPSSIKGQTKTPKPANAPAASSRAKTSEPPKKLEKPAQGRMVADLDAALDNFDFGDGEIGAAEQTSSKTSTKPATQSKPAATESSGFADDAGDFDLT